MTLTPERVETYAIRCAKGNNGGEWASHYTEDQKNFWRKFISDLVGELEWASGRNPSGSSETPEVNATKKSPQKGTRRISVSR